MRNTLLLTWLLVAIAGFALMLAAHFITDHAQQASHWGGGTMVVAEQELPDDATRLGGRSVAVRFLPLRKETKQLTLMFAASGDATKRTAQRNFQEKVILLDDFDDAFNEDLLQSGRLPRPDQPELLAGNDAAERQKLTLDGKTYQVVGTLRPEESLFANAYLARKNDASTHLLDTQDDSVKQAVVFSRTELKGVRPQLKEVFPKERFTWVGWPHRLPRGTYYLYLLGLLALFLGGSALAIGLFIRWAERTRSRWLAPPLTEIRQRWRLLATVHVICFGLAMTSMLVIYEFPEIQKTMLLLTSAQVQGGSGVLGVAGSAYKSRNIAVAASTTLGINFLLGSFASITLPSFAIPGIGALVAFWRDFLWGVLLAPTDLMLAGRMLPHSWTLLLEGEAYILATFFALLIPIELFRPQPGITIRKRYARAVVLNLKGNLLVFLVLALAAIYEATEVILLFIPA